MSRRKGYREREKAAPADDRLLDAAAPSPPAQVRVRTSSPIAAPLVCVLLLVAVAIVFGQTANCNFINFDDDEYVYENKHVSAGLTGEATAWAVTTYYACNWHPLTWFSHMLDCRLYGLDPGGHHLTNVFLHAAAAVLLFLTLRRMTGAIWRSALAAAVFAIHPLRVESVAWVAERKDVLSGLLFMLTLWFYAGYAQRPASWGRYLVVVASYALGLAAKPMLVTLPLVLLLLDYWPLRRFSPLGVGVGPPSHFRKANERPACECGLKSTPGLFIRLVFEKVPLLVLAAATCLVTLAAQRDAMPSLDRLTFAASAANAAMAYVAYLAKMLYPADLAVLYPLPMGPRPVWEAVAAVSLLLAISAAVFMTRRKCPYLLFGWLWYLGTLVPTIGLVQVGNQAIADRYTYLPQIGLYVALAWGTADLAKRWPHRRLAFATVSAVLAAVLMVGAWQQTQHWRDSETLWTHTLACTSQNWMARYQFGLAMASNGQIDEAISQYRMALDILPDYVAANYKLGVTLAARGQADEAIVHYRKALDTWPNYMDAHNNLGIALVSRGEVDEAIAHFRRALEIDPDYAPACYNLGLAMARRGEVDEAIANFRRALELEPDYPQAHVKLAEVLAGCGRLDEARTHYEKALELASARATAHWPTSFVPRSGFADPLRLAAMPCNRGRSSPR